MTGRRATLFDISQGAAVVSGAHDADPDFYSPPVWICPDVVVNVPCYP